MVDEPRDALRVDLTKTFVAEGGRMPWQTGQVEHGAGDGRDGQPLDVRHMVRGQPERLVDAAADRFVVAALYPFDLYGLTREPVEAVELRRGLTADGGPIAGGELLEPQVLQPRARKPGVKVQTAPDAVDPSGSFAVPQVRVRTARGHGLG
ncbi:MAG TPA: hypothetical protein VHI95_01235 [Acidimicrobiales bacterium]|nr:hypothetical protein [Acidimicrobiales bacterium]